MRLDNDCYQSFEKMSKEASLIFRPTGLRETPQRPVVTFD